MSRILPYPASGDPWQDSSLRQSLNEESEPCFAGFFISSLRHEKTAPKGRFSRSRILPHPASGDPWQDSSLRQSLNEESEPCFAGFFYLFSPPRKNRPKGTVFRGGEKRIRTSDTLRYTRFPSGHIRPL